MKDDISQNNIPAIATFYLVYIYNIESFLFGGTLLELFLKEN